MKKELETVYRNRPPQSISLNRTMWADIDKDAETIGVSRSKVLEWAYGVWKKTLPIADVLQQIKLLHGGLKTREKVSK